MKNRINYILKSLKSRTLLLVFLLLTAVFPTASAQDSELFSLGAETDSGEGFSLYPDKYTEFIAHDFGFEDRMFWIGRDDIQADFPYVLPGPKNGWGGTGHTAGIRSHFLNLGFVLDKATGASGKLKIDLVDTDSLHAPHLKVLVNGEDFQFNLKKGSGLVLEKGEGTPDSGQLIEIPLAEGILKNGLNRISITILDGGWIAFDRISLATTLSPDLIKPQDAVLGEVTAATYQLEDSGTIVQPLLVEIFHLDENPELTVKLDGKEILTQKLEEGKYLLEAGMPGVSQPTNSTYEILLDGKSVKHGEITRSPQPMHGLSGYVNTLLGTAHSRWMIAPGPWMPFGMVKLSPDNQNSGWQAGYDPNFESIGTFSHIHEWTMTGLGTFPTAGELVWTTVGDQSDVDSGYRSTIDKSSEYAGIGLYKVHLTDTDIWASLTATDRASFQKYEFGQGERGRIMVDLSIPTEYGYQIESCEITRVSPTRIEGKSHQLTPNAWSKGVGQDYIVHFVIEFDQPIAEFGHWVDGRIVKGENLFATDPKSAGAFVEFDILQNKTVQMRTGISYVSIENAAENLSVEISNPFGWDFDAVVANQQTVWNGLLDRVKVSSNDAREKERFYTNMYRALASRNTFSDVDGRWRDADENIQQFEDPNDLALGCDAFWNTFWNLNQFWNLVTPEWSNKWVRSQLAMYDNAGWLAKGPAGMEYIPVMVAEHEIALIVGAYQMGIRDFDVEKAFEAVVKMQTTEATEVGGGFAGNRDLLTYLEHHYVPYDQGRFSNSLEYSFDDWTVGQFAKSLGKTAEYEQFNERGSWWKNVIDPSTGYARMKDSEGKWLEDFDPFTSGANHHYVEGNAWQLSFFVPQDVPGLMKEIGKEKFLERLEWGFEESDRWRFNGPNDQYWDYPVVQGNQQSMHFAFLFNYAGKPWLTQKWSRAILDRYYGYDVTNAYLGDEDQGQMSAWFVMASLGLFQVDGGTRSEPIYEIASPLFEQVEIKLDNQYGRGEKFIITAKNASRKNKYVQSATLNGKPLHQFWFGVNELLQGGELILEMGPNPNENWGTGKLPY
ncbi:putative alpha-1,2-mannosidase [Algoriphagus sp. 4150]|uniref:GH92 family glycosyl hydrolase n=1 Tax=Algoriphagus sp. 4150 TaxID=2817756 RepID=UPI00286546F7|nr:GH92 family glycosyl hydrolase [Algoriphagus sp. 4150]MDR7130934.1 putative alpha-1,2-mannosidase [Algoriphagus sp. 4150]